MFLDKAFGSASDEVVIEERMFGEKASLLAFCDGKTVVPMIAAQDHKRALDGDLGLNTGGMGAYSPAPVLTPGLLKETIEKVLKPTMEAMASEGMPYVGCLYAGLMITKAGIKVVEFNARFGDPETQVVLPLLDTDLYEILDACTEGRLHDIDIKWKEGSCATVVAASGGYPKAYAKGKVITGLEEANKVEDAIVFHAGTKLNEDKNIVTSGGRVLNVTATAPNLKDALGKCYESISHIKFDDMQFRRCLLYTSPSPRDYAASRMPSSA